jgi:hypothetical protein
MLAHENHYTSEKFLDGVCWKLCCAARTRRRAKHLPETFPGAGEGIRTPDPLITNQMLYQLSYASSMRQLHLRGARIPLIPS